MNIQDKNAIKKLLAEKKWISDGAFGTYYASCYDTTDLPEMGNLLYPERVVQIHREYIAAGADIIRTNTYACNFMNMKRFEQKKECIRKGFALAKLAVEEAKKEGISRDILIAADLGPIAHGRGGDRQQIQQEYVEICKIFLEQGAQFFVFETLSNLEDVLPAIDLVGEKAFVWVQFAMSQFGYSSAGLSARKLMEEAGKHKYIDAVGLNCGVGPGHMHKILGQVHAGRHQFVSALPNAGYPQTVSNRMIFSDKNLSYFAGKVCEIAKEHADIVGGCCGTTPEYIKQLAGMLDRKPLVRDRQWELEAERIVEKSDHSFFHGKQKKLIAVELAPPMGSDDEKMMDAAHLLRESGVDVLTFPDSPSGRTRADSILMAEKVQRETRIPVMPHICCRDKNAIAMRSQLLGAQINGIYNFLVITGDPIPSIERDQIKSVFNFDSVGLMQMMSDMNGEQFQKAPICYGGAINQGRRNLEVEIRRVKRKMEMGAEFFLTQPVSTTEGAERLRRVKRETGARILCGIMPFVSLKNALFMKNEMTGIEVDETVLARYRADMTKEEGEQAGIELARDMIALTKDFADGYYFSFPFNRVYLLKEILKDSLL